MAKCLLCVRIDASLSYVVDLTRTLAVAGLRSFSSVRTEEQVSIRFPISFYKTFKCGKTLLHNLLVMAEYFYLA